MKSVLNKQLNIENNMTGQILPLSERLNQAKDKEKYGITEYKDIDRILSKLFSTPVKSLVSSRFYTTIRDFYDDYLLKRYGMNLDYRDCALTFDAFLRMTLFNMKDCCECQRKEYPNREVDDIDYESLDLNFYFSFFMDNELNGKSNDIIHEFLNINFESFMDYVWDMEEHMVDIHIDTSSRHFKSWETFRIGDFFHIIKEKLGLPWIPHKDCDEYLSRVRNAYVHLKEGLFIPLYILSLSEKDRRKSLDEQNETHNTDINPVLSKSY